MKVERTIAQLLTLVSVIASDSKSHER